MSERKRKAVVFDDMLRKPQDWAKAKKIKKSMFVSQSSLLDNAMLEALTETYTSTSDLSKGDCEDMAVVLVAGAPPDTPVNRDLEVSHKTLSSFTPRHQKPKIANITKEAQGLAARSKNQSSFNVQTTDHMVFTKLARTEYPRKDMLVLKGDSSLNQFVVPVYNIKNYYSCPTSQADALFPASSDALGFEDSDMQAGAEEVALLEKDQVIPFPKELPPEFTEEMCNLLGIEVLVDLHVGAGWKGCAALSRNIRAILVPNNKAHKDWVIKNLVEFVQKRNLVTFNPRAKPKELTAWEVVTNINIESI